VGAILGPMPGGIGWMEIMLLLLVMLLVFGPKRLPEMGRSLGRGIREFKESVTGEDKDDDDEPRKTELTPPPAATPDATTTQRESERV
jgi:sec-independent protein translocase protein TatA